MIHLVRHGETAGNAGRVFQHPDTPLSPRGLAQARALGERFRGEAILAVLCSDYARAEATARHIAEAARVPLQREPLLRERNFGELRGTPYAALGLDPFAPDYAPPGGEGWPEFHARVDAAWQAVREAARLAGGPIAVVTHGLVCLSLAQRHLVLADPDALAPHGFANTSVTSVTREPPHRVTRLGCTLHLGDDAPESGPA